MYQLKTKNLPHKNKLKCRICGRVFRHLGSHLWHRHGVLAKEYKEEYGLPFREALISTDIYEKKRNKFELDREKYLKNLLRGGKKHQFKKGNSGVRRVSALERQRFIKRIEGVNKRKGKLLPCPVCRMKFYHIESHLFNKHRLIRV